MRGCGSPYRWRQGCGRTRSAAWSRRTGSTAECLLGGSCCPTTGRGTLGLTCLDRSEGQAGEVGPTRLLSTSTAFLRIERAGRIDFALEPSEEGCSAVGAGLPGVVPGVHGVGRLTCLEASLRPAWEVLLLSVSRNVRSDTLLTHLEGVLSSGARPGCD